MDESQNVVDSMVDVLGESEKFLARYFDKDLCASQDLALKMVDDFKTVPLLSKDEAKGRAQKNFTTLCDFPLKLLFHPIPQGSSSEMVALDDAPLQVTLQVGQNILEWNIVGLVIPKQAQAKHFRPVLTICPMDSSPWSTFVHQRRAKMDEAIQKMDPDLQTQLIFEVVAKREELMTTIVKVVVDYNRHKEYSEMRLANCHFVADICKAVGIPASTIIKSLRQCREDVGRGQFTKQHFASHLALDSFVIDLNWKDKTASLPQVDIPVSYTHLTLPTIYSV